MPIINRQGVEEEFMPARRTRSDFDGATRSLSPRLISRWSGKHQGPRHSHKKLAGQVLRRLAAPERWEYHVRDQVGQGLTDKGLPDDFRCQGGHQ